MKHAIAPTLTCVLGTIVGLVFGFAWARSFGAARDASVCLDEVRVLADDKPVRCDRTDQLMLERPIGYGRVMVTCSCMKKPTDDPNAPAFIELTDDEKKMLEEARDAGELDSKDGGPL